MASENYEKLRGQLLVEKERIMESKKEVISDDLNKFEKKFRELQSIVYFKLLDGSNGSGGNRYNDRFYGNFLAQANRVLCYSIGNAVSHQVCNSGINMLVNPFTFINHTFNSIVIRYKHEISHMIRMDYKFVNELSKIYPRIMPILASDLLVNEGLKSEGETIPDDMWTPKTLKNMFDADIEITTGKDGDTVKTVTLKLKEIYDNNEKFREFVDATNKGKVQQALQQLNQAIQEVVKGGNAKSVGGAEVGAAGGDGQEGEGGSGASGGSTKYSEDMARDLMTSLLQDGASDDSLVNDMLKQVTVKTAQQSRGRFPAGLQSYIELAMAPPVIPWQQYLAKFIASVTAGIKPTVFRLNRRQPHRLDLKGELKDKEVEIVFAIDTSGSVSDDMIADITNELFNLTKLMKADITVLECDTRVYEPYKASKPSDIHRNVRGRGGTEFTPVFRWMKENKKKDAILIFATDGFGESQLACKPIHQGTLFLLPDKKEDLSLKGPNLPKKTKVISFTNSLT